MNFTWLYVALLYAAAVWIARRMGTPLPWRVAALFYALVLVFLWRPLTGPYVNLPVDCLTRLPPWYAFMRHVRPQNCEINDIYMQMVPWASQVRHQWKAFQFPLWNPTEGSGGVLLANGQSAALSPLRLLALPLALGQSFAAEAAMKILIALTFTFLFCRRRGYSDLASATGAAAFSFGTFMIVWLHFPHATVAAYLPAVLYQIDLLAERVTFGRIVFSAVIWTCALFGGHPESALHIGVIATAMVIWILLVERRFATRRDAMRFIGSLALAMFIAALLSAPFLVPFAEALTKSQRYQLLRKHPWSIGFTDGQSMLLLLQPHFYGATPADRTWGPAVAESICGWSGILGFAGWLALLLDAITRRSRWRTREMFFVVMAPLVLAILTDFPIIGSFFNDVFTFAANARVRLLLSFVMAMLAASMIDLIQRGRIRPALIAIAVVLGGFLALLLTTHFPSAWIHDNTVLSMLPSVLVLALAAAGAATIRGRDVVLMLASAAVVAEIWAVDRGWNSTVSDSLMYPETPLIKRLEQLRAAAPPGGFRIVGLGAAMFPNTGAPFEFEDIRVHDPMGNGRYLGVLRVLTDYDSEAYFAHWKDMKTRFLDFLNVKYIVASRGTELSDIQRYTRIYDGIDGEIFRNNDALPRFYAARNVVLEFKGAVFASRLETENDWAHTGVVKTLPVESDRMRQDLLAPRPINAPEATVKIVDASATRYWLRVHAPRWTLVVSSVPIWPGWHIVMPGRRLDPLPVNGAFLGFTVPPGDYDVEVYYRPASFYASLIVAMLTIVALAALSLRRRQRVANIASPKASV